MKKKRIRKTRRPAPATKDAATKLQDSKELYRTLVENISLGITLIDTNYRIIMTNAGQGRIFKKDPSQFVGKYCFKEFEKRDAVCSHCPGTRAMATGRPAEVKTVGVRDDGSRSPALIHAFPVYEADGTVKGFIEVVEDISEREEAKESLRTTEAQLSNAMKIAKLGYWEYDVAADLFTFNDQFYSIFRTSAEQVGGYKMSSARYAQQFLHPDDASVVATETKKAIEATDPNYSRQLEHRIVYADGEIGYIAVRFSIVKDEQGHTVKTFGANQDITEYKKAEQALKESQERYKMLLENIPQKIFLKDTNSVYISCNDGYAADLKTTPEEIKGKTDYEFYPKQLADKYRADDREVINSGETKEIEERYLLEGQERIVHTTKTPVRDVQGHVTGVFGIFWDITERKHAEQELKEAHEELKKARDELEIRVRERTAELEETVEKLRNEISERKKAEEKLLIYQKQLRSLALELSLAEERLRRKIATDVHDHLGQNLAISKMKIESLLQSAASPELAKALKEIRDLIAQAVESTRSLTFELSPPVLYELGFVPAVQWLLRQTRQQHGLSTEFTDDKRSKPLDDDVRVLLFQAVKELLVNIAKHAKAKSVKVSTQRISSKIRISVEDDGVGFDVAQVHPQNHMTGGFGLFNIRERLDHIGGHLDIVSRTGKGTRITLTAPITHNKEKTRGNKNEHKNLISR